MNFSVADHPWLQGLETPFLWTPAELLRPVYGPGIIPDLEAKEQRMARDIQKVFTFNMFVVGLVLSHELFVHTENATQSMLKLNKLEQLLHTQDILSNDSFFRQVRRAEWHVLLATKAVLLAQTNQTEESKQVVGDSFDHVSTFNPQERAGLYGIKARSFLEYGSQGAAEALKWAKRAIETNPQEAEWYLLAGRAMETTRRTRIISEVPTEEFSFFQKAAALSDHPRYALHLARVYEQVAMAANQRRNYERFISKTPFFMDTMGLTNSCIQVYRDLIKKHPNDTDTLTKCLEGLLEIPRQFLDEDELADVVERVSQAPNKSLRYYSTMSTYYLKIRRDRPSAIRILNQGVALGDYKSAINNLRLVRRKGDNFDMEIALINLTRKFKDDLEDYQSALTTLGSFYLFVRRDMWNALDTFNAVLRINPRCKFMLVHQPIFVRSPRPLNLFTILWNEVRVADVVPARKPVHWHAKKLLTDVLQEYHPDVFQSEMDIQMMTKIFTISDRMVHSRPSLRPTLRQYRPPGDALP